MRTIGDEDEKILKRLRGEEGPEETKKSSSGKKKEK